MAWTPPAYSTTLPHPRSPLDILQRTFAIQFFSAVAYYHLLSLLAFRKPHGSALNPLLVLAFAFMPELLLTQLVLWLLPLLLSRPWRRLVARRMRSLPYELGNGDKCISPAWLLARSAFAVLGAVPLAAVLGAYRQRLGMRWHSSTYVANLGLDHRNGWAAVGGLICSLLSVGLAAALAVIVALAEARREEDDGMKIAESGGQQDVRGREGKSAQGARLWIVGGVGEVDWPAVSEVVYTSLVHQILLAVTNHLVPVMVLLRAWYLWPLIGLGLWWLYVKRGVRREVLGLGAAVAFVALTAGVQIYGDGVELWRVSHGEMRPWNFRWGVRDWFSAKVKEGS